MSLAFLTLGLPTAQAQDEANPGPIQAGPTQPVGPVQPVPTGWTVTDQDGHPLTLNQDGSGYPLKGPMTGSATLSPVYQDVFSVAGQPNSSIGYAFTPNPNDYQGWLFNGGSTPPGGGYDPYHVWTSASADNYVSRNSGAMGYLGAPWNEVINGSVTANTGGTLWAVFQWNGPHPPDHLDLLLRTTVRANADPQAGGLSSSATATDSTFNGTASAPGGVPLVQGRHLLRVPVDPNTNKASVSLGGTAMATATNSLPYGVLGYYPGTTSGPYFQTTNGPAGTSAGSSIGADASFDYREATVSSPTIEDSFYKGAYDTQHGSDRYQYQRDPVTGAMSVESAATYSDADNANGWIANATLDAEAANYNYPKYAWASDFNPAAMVGVDMTQPSIPAAWFIGDGSNLPVTKTITLTVTDGDGASALNTYTIKWHQPFEQWADCQPAVQDVVDIVPTTTQPTNTPGGQIAYSGDVFHCTFEYGPNQLADGIEEAQKILPVAQPFYKPIWQSLIAATLMPFDKAALGVVTTDDVVNDQAAFDEAVSLTNSGRDALVQTDSSGNIHSSGEYKMVGAVLSVHNTVRFLQGNAYDAHGYAGPSSSETSRKMSSVQATGKYNLINPQQ